MAKNLIADLLQSPSAAKAQLDEELQLKGALAAKPFIGATNAYNPISGAMNRLTATMLQGSPQAASQMVRGVTGGLGSLASGMGATQAGDALRRMGLSPQEQQAEAINKAAVGMARTPEGLREFAQKLREMGRGDLAERIDDKADALMLKTRELDIKERELLSGKNASTAEKTIRYFAEQVLKCDMNDPKCLKEAMQMAIDYKRSDTAANQMNVHSYKALGDKYTKAEQSRVNIQTANEALKQLDSGRVNIGAFGNTRQDAEKLYAQILQSMGVNVVDEQDAVARTAELLAKTKRLGGQLLASGMFGSGTGISERDLQTAMEMAGASESLTPQAMIQILKYNAQFEQAALKNYNNQLNRYSTAFWNRVPEGGKAAYAVDIPEIYQMKTDKTMKVQVRLDDQTYSVPKGAVVGKASDGTYRYKFRGKIYNMDGTEVK